MGKSIPCSPLSLYHRKMNTLIEIFTELGRVTRLGAQWLANLLDDHSDDSVKPDQKPENAED